MYRERRTQRRRQVGRDRDRLRGGVMAERSLQVSYRKGRPFAAYLHLPRAKGEKSARTVACSDGLLIVGYSESARALGVDITGPRAVLAGTLERPACRVGRVALGRASLRARF